jgi:hypothetical protein
MLGLVSLEGRHTLRNSNIDVKALPFCILHLGLYLIGNATVVVWWGVPARREVIIAFYAIGSLLCVVGSCSIARIWRH